MTYLTRRYAGVFYVRFRITTSSGRRRLLRFSLGTTDKLQARILLTDYLTWLIPMQTATQPGLLFNDILAQGRSMILKGPARTREEVSRRVRFVETAWAHREDWIASDPCPIRDHVAFERNDEVRCTLVFLNEMLAEDMKRLEITHADVRFISLRGASIQALAFDKATGKIRAYEPEEMRDLYDEDADVEFGLRENETSIYDLYIEPDGKPKKIQTVAAATTPFVKQETSAAPKPAVFSEDAAMPAESNVKLSEAKQAYLEMRQIAKGDGRAEEDAGLVIDFMIAFLGDRYVTRISSRDLQAFEVAMAETPDRLHIPRDHTGSLYARYTYAKANGYAGLKMLSATRLTNVWYRCLHQFFAWMKQKEIASLDYRFSLVPSNASSAVARDAWTNDEILKLFSLPLFTGCHSKDNFWTPGSCFVQNEMYWAYILIFFTGMRNSEIGTLNTDNIVCDQGMMFFDLGTKQRRTVVRSLGVGGQAAVQKRKSKAGHRRIPIPKLLIDLGFLDRVEALKGKGVASVFPEWKPVSNQKSGREMPGHRLSKSWQYVKKKFSFVGDELTIYGGRHTRAEWYDEINLPELIKRKCLGHEPRDAHEGYGSNVLTIEEAKLALQEMPIERQIAGILIIAKLRAEYKELNVIKTWL